MLGALPALLNSEKAVMAILLLVAATVLAALGQLPIPMWKELAESVFLIYVGGKTVQGSAALISDAMRAKAGA
jgi:hypothetical protein